MPTIYLKATGEALECASVDAREILHSSPELYCATSPDLTAKAVPPEGSDAVTGDGSGEALPPIEDYEAMKVADLKDLAAARGVDLGDASKKADIIAALELAAEAAQEPAE